MTAAARRVPHEDVGVAFEEHMVQLVRSLGLLKADETPCGQPVSIGEAHALLEIAREPGMTQNGLAARLRLEKSTISRLAALLERRGWLRRVRDECDGRCVRLHLTQRGLKANARIAGSRRERFERLFAAIPPAQRQSVVASLAVLLEVTRDS